VNNTPVVTLKEGRAHPVLRRHPWIFSGAVAHAPENLAPGETVAVHDADGQFLAWAAYSPDSQIRARVWSLDPETVIGRDFFARRLQASLKKRYREGGGAFPEAARLVYGEADQIPGLVVDKYGEILVCQFLSAGAERWRETLADLLVEKSEARSLYERSDVEVRNLEGFSPRTGLLRGDPVSERVVIRENELRFEVDIREGHKTGFYLDQKENRARVRQLSRGKAVLDCFGYTGGFSVNALAGGAEGVTLVETSSEALGQAQKHVRLNGLPEEKLEMVEGDAFQLLRLFRDQARSFDVVILDPPKFAPTSAHAQRAARGYKDINLLGMKLLRPGGILVTFSCSGGIDRGFFQKILAGAALDAEVNAQVLEHLSQNSDHPIALHYPESEYLKGFVIRVS
jgi:23S rRNA (cytosine1962-C5)-methyltransferase